VWVRSGRIRIACWMRFAREFCLAMMSLDEERMLKFRTIQVRIVLLPLRVRIGLLLPRAALPPEHRRPDHPGDGAVLEVTVTADRGGGAAAAIEVPDAASVETVVGSLGADVAPVDRGAGDADSADRPQGAVNGRGFQFPPLPGQAGPHRVEVVQRHIM